MTDFKTTLLELAEPSEKTYASEDLKALESKSNFVLKSDAVEDLGALKVQRSFWSIPPPQTNPPLPECSAKTHHRTL